MATDSSCAQRERNRSCKYRSVRFTGITMLPVQDRQNDRGNRCSNQPESFRDVGSNSYSRFQQLFEVPTYVLLAEFQGNGGCVTRRYTVLQRHLRIGSTTRHSMYYAESRGFSVLRGGKSLHYKHTIDLQYMLTHIATQMPRISPWQKPGDLLVLFTITRIIHLILLTPGAIRP
jgi:hypothetical protein